MSELYSIGDFSRLARISIKTLRYYDEVDLLKPCAINPETRYRYYSTRQLETVAIIVELRQVGVSVNDIRDILTGKPELPILYARQNQLHELIGETQTCLHRLNHLIQLKENHDDLEFNVVIKELPDCIVIYRQAMIDNYNQCGNFIEESIAAMQASNPGIPCDDSYVYMAYLDEKYQESQIHVEFAWSVKAMGTETETIKFKRLKKVKAACIMAKGAFETALPAAYARMNKWLSSNGYRICGAPRDHYIDGPWNQSNPDAFLTEIQFPIE